MKKEIEEIVVIIMKYMGDVLSHEIITNKSMSQHVLEVENMIGVISNNYPDAYWIEIMDNNDKEEINIPDTIQYRIRRGLTIGVTPEEEKKLKANFREFAGVVNIVTKESRIINISDRGGPDDTGGYSWGELRSFIPGNTEDKRVIYEKYITTPEEVEEEIRKTLES